MKTNESGFELKIFPDVGAGIRTPAGFSNLLGDEHPQLVVDLCRLSVNMLLQSRRRQVARGLVLQQNQVCVSLVARQQLACRRSPVLLLILVMEELKFCRGVVLLEVGGPREVIHLRVGVAV